MSRSSGRIPGAQRVPRPESGCSRHRGVAGFRVVISSLGGALR